MFPWPGWLERCPREQPGQLRVLLHGRRLHHLRGAQGGAQEGRGRGSQLRQTRPAAVELDTNCIEALTNVLENTDM